MATVPSFTISTQGDGKGFNFTDITGAYSVTNTSGYDESCVLVGTNIKTDDVTTCTIVITDPSGGVYTKTMTGVLPDIANPSCLISNVNLGLDSDATIPDGYYVFTYNLSGVNNCLESPAPFSLVSQVRYFNLFTAQCSVDRLFKDVKAQLDCKMEDTFALILSAQTYLNAVGDAAQCGMVNRANDLFAKVRTLLNSTNCPTCN